MSNKFDEWDDLKDCNTCDNYWNDTCDGVPEEQKRNCQSYVATRKVVIPKQIEELQKDVGRVTKSTIILALAVLLHLVSHIIGV